MATKVDSVANMESQLVQTSVSSSQKVPKFAAKAGFVIPKNKLSGSLVPAIRGSRKVDSSETIKDEVDTKAQRKTKWGADVTLDAAVRKGRILAYQTRLQQITEQLGSLKSDIVNDEGSKSPSESSVTDSSKKSLKDELGKLEQLELEKREVIGELLRLNPNYKAPADYKPLLKEANIPIPIKEYPGHNFIGLLLGPESNTQKRLEEETGTKVQVQGFKANTREKCEITRSDLSESQSMFDELYVHISADTYEKVDAAVALIELLFKPVTGNSTVEHAVNQTDGNIANSSDQISTAPSGTISQVAVQPVAVPAQPHPLSYAAYPPNWYPNPPNASVASPGFMPQPISNNFSRIPSSSMSTPSPLYVTPQPSYNPSVRHPSVSSGQLQPLQALQRPMDPALQRANFNVVSRPPLTHPPMQGQPVSNAPFRFPAATQPMSIPSSSPVVPSSQQFPISTAGPVQSRPVGSSPGWSNVPPAASTSGTFPPQPVFPSPVPAQRPLIVGTQGTNAMPSQQNMPSSMVGRPQSVNVTPVSIPSQSSAMPSNFSAAQSPVGPTPVVAVTSSSVGPMPASVPPPMFTTVPRSSSLSASAMGPHSPHMRGLQTHSPVLAQPSATPSTVPSGFAHASGPTPFMGPVNPGFSPSQPPAAMSSSATGNFPNLPPVNSPSASSVNLASAPKPPRPSAGDFTFQPVRNIGPGSLPSPRPSEQATAQYNHTLPTSLPQVSVPQSNQFLQVAPQNQLNQNMAQVPHAPGNQSASQFSPAAAPRPPVQNTQPPAAPSAPQVPSFRPVIQNLGNPMSLPSAPRAGPVGLVQVPVSASHSNIRPAGPPRFPVIPSPQNATAPNTTAQRGPPSFMSPPQLPNFSGPPTHLRPNHSLPPPNQFPSPNPPRGIMIPSQQVGNNQQGFVAMRPVSSPGGNQTYDPFSPTSIPSSAPPQIRDGQQMSGKPETDAEYEDLMASVGVR